MRARGMPQNQCHWSRMECWVRGCQTCDVQEEHCGSKPRQSEAFDTSPGLCINRSSLRLLRCTIAICWPVDPAKELTFRSKFTPPIFTQQCEGHLIYTRAWGLEGSRKFEWMGKSVKSLVMFCGLHNFASGSPRRGRSNTRSGEAWHLKVLDWLQLVVWKAPHESRIARKYHTIKN